MDQIILIDWLPVFVVAIISCLIFAGLIFISRLFDSNSSSVQLNLSFLFDLAGKIDPRILPAKKHLGAIIVFIIILINSIYLFPWVLIVDHPRFGRRALIGMMLFLALFVLGCLYSRVKLFSDEIKDDY